MKKHAKHIPLPIILLVAFFVSAIGVAAGTFIVSAHGGDVSKIHACVKTTLLNGPNIRIIGANGTCNSNETALDWNIQGVPGHSGPPGPTGVPGEGGSSAFICIGCKERDLLLRINQQNLLNVDFDSAILTNSIIVSQDLSGSSFVNAVLGSVQGRGSNLSSTNFTNANLDSADLREANFTNANLSGADMTDASVDEATWSNTICPDGTNSDSNGNTCLGHL